MRILTIFLSLAAILMSGCANPEITSIHRTELSQIDASPIYVARFEGNPDFVEECTDMLVTQLASKSGISIIQGESARQEGPDIIKGGNLASRESVAASAARNGAKLFLMSKMTTYNNDGTLNAFATIRIIRTSDGAILGQIHRDSGLLVAYS